jgi:hypothetical protein
MNQRHSIQPTAKHFGRKNNILEPVKMFIKQNILDHFDFLAQPNHHPTLT